MKLTLDRFSMKQKDFVNESLARFGFVYWDRFTLGEHGEAHWLTVFGWINRPDNYKDFLELELDLDRLEVSHFVTSSAQYSETIAELIGMKSEHNPCNRVEDIPWLWSDTLTCKVAMPLACLNPKQKVAEP